MKHFIQTQYRRLPTKGEINSGELVTVPDMTLSLKDLLLNHTRESLYRGYEPQFSDEYIPNPRALDLTDIDQMRRNLETQTDEINEQIQSDIKAQKAAAAANAAAKAAQQSASTDPTPTTVL